MRVLFIDRLTLGRIEGLMDYASLHRVGQAELALIAAGKRRPVGDVRRHCLYIPQGFRVVYSIEEQPEAGWCRHLSVSVDGDRYPSPAAIDEIARHFGFTARTAEAERGGLAKARVYMEEQVRAVNLVEPIEQ